MDIQSREMGQPNLDKSGQWEVVRIFAKYVASLMWTCFVDDPTICSVW